MNDPLVSEAERAFFREILKDAKPIPKRRIAGLSAKPAGPPRHAAPSPPVHADARVPAIGGRREAQLKRGRIAPEARIDLHGLTQEVAHRALRRFFEQARAKGQRVVLVITGKGGILREIVPRWLGEMEFRGVVAGITPAHIRHGGEGALYVALRRKRSK